jgi:oxazoline/thiazoline synthase
VRGLHRRLSWKLHLQAVVVGDDRVFLLGDGEHYLLRGESYVALAPWLDGAHTLEWLVQRAGANAPAHYFALRTLLERGYIAEVPEGSALGELTTDSGHAQPGASAGGVAAGYDAAPGGEDGARYRQADRSVAGPLGRQAGSRVEGAAVAGPGAVATGPLAAGAARASGRGDGGGVAEACFWQALGSDLGQVQARLAGAAVAARAVGGADVGLMREALEEAGLRVVADAALVVVVTPDYLAIDAPLRSGRWLPVRLDGLTPWIGPLFGAPGRGCWRCLQHRLRWNQPVETWLARRGHVVSPRRGSLRASARVAANVAALTLAWWTSDGGVGAIDDHLLTLSLTELRTTSHRVVRRPQCPGCGDPTWMARQGARPVELVSRPRHPEALGGYRVVDAEATVARLAAQVSPITGVVASVGATVGRDHPLRPVHSAVYRVTPADDEPDFDDFHRLSSGKGRTAMQARASALGEALERISAIWHGDEPVLRVRPSSLRHPAVHPDQLQLFSARQMQARRPEDRSRHRVAAPAEPDVELDWSPAWSLSRHRLVYLPTAYCFQHTPVAADRERCVFNPNGHAAGNVLEEAVLQGLLELMERDAIAIWWYNRLRAPGLALESFAEPYFAELRAHYRALGYHVWVLDLTTDLGVPTFAALAERSDRARHAIGFGCHLDAQVGVRRALTELNQIFAPDETTPAPWDARALADDAFLRPDDRMDARRASAYPPSVAGDLRDDVLRCVELLAAAGLETLVLDQSRPELELAAVKVVVPGLRHFWPRLGPGRLYDVPVQLGRLSAPLPEQDLNPVPLLL